MSKPPTIISSLQTQWASITGQGITLELWSAATPEAEAIHLATIVADEDERLFFETYKENSPLRIPLSELQTAIDLARNDVHGENYYGKQSDL